ncbi:MAG: GNAT family N-acetyltransferase [Dehalococcoidales bacterium]|nr:GNAT family N-acetyltransferase [Dehalococcoidales bacterium]
MTELEYKTDKEIEPEKLKHLFLSVGWPVGHHSGRLRTALINSHRVISAWDGKKLAGLINSISDTAMIVYIPYLLVQPEYQKQGTGSMLVRLMLKEYKDYERIVLLTEKDTTGFYEKLGFRYASTTCPMMIINEL